MSSSSSDNPDKKDDDEMANLHSGPERRTRDRSEGILLRRRQQQPVDVEQRRQREDFDIAAALEMHLDQVKTRRAMIELLETWLKETRTGDAPERDDDYKYAVEHAIDVMKAAPDVLSAIAVLQRRH